MKKLLTLIAVSCFFASCCTHRLLTSSTADSVRVETVVRTEFLKDTVYIDIPRETFREVVTDSSHLETSYALSDARILPDGKLYHSLENKVQKKPVEVKKEIVYRDSIVYKERVSYEAVEVERRLTDWQRLQMTGFWIFVTAVLVWLALKWRGI